MEDLDNDASQIINEISGEDLKDLILRMRLYVESKIDFRNQNVEGLEPLDYVFSVFDKALSGIRNWDKKSHATFEEFMFGALKSDVSATFGRQKRRKGKDREDDADQETYILDIPVFEEEVGYEDPKYEEPDYESEMLRYSEILKEAGADDLELMIFECWGEGYLKPKEISEICEVDVEEVYKAFKRLERRKKKLTMI